MILIRNIMLSIAARKNRAVQQLGPLKAQELPDFLQGFAPQSWDAEEQNSFFAALSGPADQGLVRDPAAWPVLVVFYSGGLSKQQGRIIIIRIITISMLIIILLLNIMIIRGAW